MPLFLLVCVQCHMVDSIRLMYVGSETLCELLCETDQSPVALHYRRQKKQCFHLFGLVNSCIHIASRGHVQLMAVC